MWISKATGAVATRNRLLGSNGGGMALGGIFMGLRYRLNQGSDHPCAIPVPFVSHS